MPKKVGFRCPVCKAEAKSELYKYSSLTYGYAKIRVCQNPKHDFWWLPHKEEMKLLVTCQVCKNKVKKGDCKSISTCAWVCKNCNKEK